MNYSSFENREFKLKSITDKQREFIDIPHDYTLDVALFQGKHGCGKVGALALLNVLNMLKFPKSRGLITQPKDYELGQATFRTMIEILNSCGYVYGEDFEYYKPRREFTCKNGSMAIISDCRRPKEFKKQSFFWISIDEMSEISEEAFNILLSCLKQKTPLTWAINNKYQRLPSEFKIKKRDINKVQKPFCYRLYGFTKHNIFDEKDNYLHRVLYRDFPPSFYRVIDYNDDPRAVEENCQKTLYATPSWYKFMNTGDSNNWGDTYWS